MTLNDKIDKIDKHSYLRIIIKERTINRIVKSTFTLYLWFKFKLVGYN